MSSSEAAGGWGQASQHMQAGKAGGHCGGRGCMTRFAVQPPVFLPPPPCPQPQPGASRESASSARAAHTHCQRGRRTPGRPLPLPPLLPLALTRWAVWAVGRGLLPLLCLLPAPDPGCWMLHAGGQASRCKCLKQGLALHGAVRSAAAHRLSLLTQAVGPCPAGRQRDAEGREYLDDALIHAGPMQV